MENLLAFINSFNLKNYSKIANINPDEVFRYILTKWSDYFLLSDNQTYSWAKSVELLNDYFKSFVLDYRIKANIVQLNDSIEIEIINFIYEVLAAM